jgi:hypothetical protein
LPLIVVAGSSPTGIGKESVSDRSHSARDRSRQDAQEDDAVRAGPASGRRRRPTTGWRPGGRGRRGAAGGGRVDRGHAAGGELESAPAPCTRRPIGCGHHQQGRTKRTGGPTRARTRPMCAWRCWSPRPQSAAAWAEDGYLSARELSLTCATPRPGSPLGPSSAWRYGQRLLAEFAAAKAVTETPVEG